AAGSCGRARAETRTTSAPRRPDPPRSDPREPPTVSPPCGSSSTLPRRSPRCLSRRSRRSSGGERSSDLPGGAAARDVGPKVQAGHHDLAAGPFEQRTSGILFRLELHDRSGRIEPKEVAGERVHEREVRLGAREVVVREAVEDLATDLADHVPEAEKVGLWVDPEVGRTGERGTGDDRREQHRLDAFLERVHREALVAPSFATKPVRELRQIPT